MKNKFILKRLLALALLVLLLTSSAVTVLADTDLPYLSYNYDYWVDVNFTPAPYVPSGTILGTDLRWNGQPIGKFLSPQDICRDGDGNVYVADTGNHRIVVLDGTLANVLNVITGFDRDGVAETFSSPHGVAVSGSNQVYIADTMNRRIVVLDADGSLARIVENPQSLVLEDGYVFTPLKVAVDYAERIYCIAQKMFEGIMVFETDGEFTGFFGTINVKISIWEKFWRKLATKEERSKQQLFIPTEFTGIDIDSSGFVYASNVDNDGKQAVRRLNPKGEDVIRKGVNENLGGDLWVDGYWRYAGPSKIKDVVYRENGIYSLLDSKRGRIFTYDHEGNLLYIFGGLGTQQGTFTTPVAIEAIGDSIIALDAAQGAILVFKATEYGTLINNAIGLRFDGDESLAVPMWERVLQMDENNELANVGIGKAYLASGENALAMTYLKRGMNRAYYSVAYKRYRNEMLTGNLNYILTGAIVLIAAINIIKRIRKHGKAKGKGVSA